MLTPYDIDTFLMEFGLAFRKASGDAELCYACDCFLTEGEEYLCTKCRTEAPFTNLWLMRDNAMEQKFWGLIPIERAAAFLWYVKGSPWQRIIHDLKYNQTVYHGTKMARWFTKELMRSDFLDGIDLIVPIPLHWSKTLRRAFNQSEYIAYGISRVSGIPHDFRCVRRFRNNPSQTTQPYSDRWENAANMFEVTHPERMRSRHILLVDDVFTTGATIMSCAGAIIEACEGDVRISVATLAISSNAVSQE